MRSAPVGIVIGLAAVAGVALVVVPAVPAHADAVDWTASTGAYPSSVAVVDGGAYVEVAASDGTLDRVPTAGGTADPLTVHTGGSIYAAAVAANTDGTRLYVVDYGHDDLVVVDPVAQTVLDRFSLPAGTGASGLAVAPDGSTVYVLSRLLQEVIAVSASSGATVATFPVGAVPASEALGAGGAVLAVTIPGSNAVKLIATGTGATVATTSVGSDPYAIAASADGTQFFVGNSADHVLSRVRAADGVALGTFPADSVGALAVSPDGARIYTVALGSTLRVLDATTGAQLGADIPVGSNVESLVVTPNDARVFLPDEVSPGLVRRVAVGTAPALAAVSAQSAVVGSPFSLALTGGDVYPAPTFAVSGGSLPAGLALDVTTGRISGSPTKAGATTATITATNGDGASSITVALAVTAAADPAAASQELAATGPDPLPTGAAAAVLLLSGLALVGAATVRRARSIRRGRD